MRDTQRKRVYYSENESFGKQHLTNKFTFDECKLFSKRVIESRYYSTLNGYKSIKLRDGRGRRRGAYFPSTKTITLPNFSRNPLYILHEFSHALAHKTVGKDAGHHASFCTHYLNLICELIGIKEYWELRKCFDRHNVLYKEKELILI